MCDDTRLVSSQAASNWLHWPTSRQTEGSSNDVFVVVFIILMLFVIYYLLFSCASPFQTDSNG